MCSKGEQLEVLLKIRIYVSEKLPECMQKYSILLIWVKNEVLVTKNLLALLVYDAQKSFFQPPETCCLSISILIHPPENI